MVTQIYNFGTISKRNKFIKKLNEISYDILININTLQLEVTLNDNIDGLLNTLNEIYEDLK